MDNFQHVLKIQSHHIRRGMNPLQWRNICAYQHSVGKLFLAWSGANRLREGGGGEGGGGGGSGAINTPDGAPIPTSSTLGGLTAGTSPSKGKPPRSAGH